ncbi:MAG: 16S rRNA (cytosine(967)-C(5))-methyltransferase RsmB, partial [Ruminococcus sp.]
LTVLKEENQQIAEGFLRNHTEFEPVPLLPELHEKLSGSMVTLLPSFAGSDGFFMAKFRRVK